MSENLVTVETDLSGLSHALNQLGVCLDADAREMVKVESGQLAWRIAQGIGAKTLDKAKNKARIDVKKNLYAEPSKLFGPKQQGTGDTLWLYATPRAIAGIDRKNDMRSLAASAATKIYYLLRRNNLEFGSWYDAGYLKGRDAGQHAMIVQKPMVKKSVFAEIVKAIQANLGQAKASFAFATSQTTKKRIPSWISKHFPSRANDKAIYDEHGLQGDRPFMQIGSRAKGVVSNGKMVAAIDNGLNQSVAIIHAKVEKLLNGYAYDFNNGRVFRPKANEFDRN